MTTATIVPTPTPPAIVMMDQPDRSQGTLVFVYGTLRQGYGNHRLLEGARFLGVRHTAPTFTMIHLGGFPGVLATGQTSIIGEVYEVTDPEMLRRLDRLEGHPDWYRRTPIVTLEGDAVEIYIYPENDGRSRTAPVVESGDWNNREGR